MSLIRKVLPDWGRKNWKVAATDIRCKADAGGAKVFVFDDYVEGVETWPTVLAHDEASARAAAEEYVSEMQRGRI